MGPYGRRRRSQHVNGRYRLAGLSFCIKSALPLGR
jgi:hypothetical protein